MKFIATIILGGLISSLVCLSIFKTLGIGGNIPTTIEVYAGGDKALHFWGAGLISIMFCWLFSYCPNRVAFWMMSLLCVEEGLQALFPTRHFNFDDIGAGCAGVLIFVLTFKLFSK